MFCFRLRSVAFAVLVSFMPVVFQMVTPKAHAQGQESDCICDTAHSADEEKEMMDVRALSCVLATVAKELDKREDQVSGWDGTKGVHAEIDRRNPLKLSIKDLCNVQSELEHLALGQLRPCGRVIENLDYFLIRAHVKYKNLKNKRKCQKKDNLKENREFCRYLNDVDMSIHSLLARRGLHRTMSAVVRGGTTLTDVASDRQIQSGNPLVPLPKSLNVLLGTKHWRDEESPKYFDFSITGQIGVVPVLALYSLADNNSDKDVRDTKRLPPAMPEDLCALHQSAIIYATQFNVNYNRLSNSETSVFVGLGQTRLWGREANIVTRQEPRTVRLVENGPGLSAFHIEYGVEYKLYAQELDIIHHDKSLLSPVFSFAFGRRQDERLRAWPGVSLPDRGPPWRAFARLSFDLWQVFGQRKVEDKGKINTFGIRLVADREWGGIVPTANRLLLEADFNLSKLFMGNVTDD